MAFVARQLEHTGRPFDQRVKPFSGPLVRETFAIGAPFERQNDLELPAEIERDFRGDLVGAVGNRRDESQFGLGRGKAIAFGGEQSPTGFRDAFEHVANALAKDRYAVGGEDLGAMPGDADSEDEWDGRRSSQTANRCLNLQFRSGDRLLLSQSRNM